MPSGSFAAHVDAGPDIAVAKPTTSPKTARTIKNAETSWGT
jgi:hypothetical protein